MGNLVHYHRYDDVRKIIIADREEGQTHMKISYGDIVTSSEYLGGERNKPTDEKVTVIVIGHPTSVALIEDALNKL